MAGRKGLPHFLVLSRPETIEGLYASYWICLEPFVDFLATYKTGSNRIQHLFYSRLLTTPVLLDALASNKNIQVGEDRVLPEGPP